MNMEGVPQKARASQYCDRGPYYPILDYQLAGVRS